MLKRPQLVLMGFSGKENGLLSRRHVWVLSEELLQDFIM